MSYTFCLLVQTLSLARTSTIVLYGPAWLKVLPVSGAYPKIETCHRFLVIRYDWSCRHPYCRRRRRSCRRDVIVVKLLPPSCRRCRRSHLVIVTKSSCLLCCLRRRRRLVIVVVARHLIHR